MRRIFQRGIDHDEKLASERKIAKEQPVPLSDEEIERILGEV